MTWAWTVILKTI